MSRHFIVNLIDGTQYRFNNKCNNVDYRNAVVCIFKNIIDDKTNSYECLAIIPYERINSIINVEE